MKKCKSIINLEGGQAGHCKLPVICRGLLLSFGKEMFFRGIFLLPSHCFAAPEQGQTWPACRGLMGLGLFLFDLGLPLSCHWEPMERRFLRPRRHIIFPSVVQSKSQSRAVGQHKGGTQKLGTQLFLFVLFPRRGIIYRRGHPFMAFSTACFAWQ